MPVQATRLTDLVAQNHSETIAKLVDCDLDPVGPILARLYAPVGRPSRDPFTLFRATLLMNWQGFTEFEPWVEELRTHPLWAGLCGFDPDTVPGASTLRDFLRHLTRAWPRRARLRKPRRAAQERTATRRDQKLPERHPDVLKRVLDWLPPREGQPDQPAQDDQQNGSNPRQRIGGRHVESERHHVASLAHRL